MKPHLLFATLTCLSLASGPVHAASSTDPDWPCIQRKVPNLSLAQVWQGPELPASAAEWDKDSRLSALVAELAARKVPLEDARKLLNDYAASVPSDQRNEKLAQLVQGLFEKLNGERQQVISGISRYAQKQREMAADLRKTASELGRQRAAADADAAEIEKSTQRLTWETRIFEERVESLTFVCEVPTIIEQRLYGLSQMISQMMMKNG